MVIELEPSKILAAINLVVIIFILGAWFFQWRKIKVWNEELIKGYGVAQRELKKARSDLDVLQFKDDRLIQAISSQTKAVNTLIHSLTAGELNDSENN